MAKNADFLNKNIGYIIWLEDLGYHVLTSQVFEVLIEAKKQLPAKHDYYIVAFQDIRSFLINIIKGYRDKYRIKDAGIKVIIVPIITFSKSIDYFYAKWLVLLFIVLPQALFWLFFIVLFKKLKILHCRSYVSSLPACLLKIIFRIRVIFDPRSPFIDEAILCDKIRAGTISHKLWLFFESFIVTKTDAIIIISNSFAQYFSKFNSSASFISIPNNVNTNKFKLNLLKRKELRNQIGFSEEDIVICYSGSLGKQWNDPSVYANFVDNVLKHFPNFQFLFLTKQKNNLERELLNRKITKDRYKIVSASLETMPYYLSIADFGLNLMQHVDLRLSIKTVEYLSMGLPLIITSCVRGALEMVDKYDVGYVIDNLDDINFQTLSKFIAKKDQYVKKSRDIAVKYFSTEIVGNQYYELYMNMLSKV